MSEDQRQNGIRAAVALKAAIDLVAGQSVPWGDITEAADYFLAWLESKEGVGPADAPKPAPPPPPPQYQAPSNGVKCPQCGSDMWDNRPKKAAGEYQMNAPDFKCKANRDHVIWPPEPC